MLANSAGPSHARRLGWEVGTDPGLLFALLRSSEGAPFSAGTRPLSGRSLPGGLGGTRIRSRKMHFFFLISLPQRNLGSGQGEERALGSVVHPPGEEPQALNLRSDLLNPRAKIQSGLWRR